MKWEGKGGNVDEADKAVILLSCANHENLLPSQFRPPGNIPFAVELQHLCLMLILASSVHSLP